MRITRNQPVTREKRELARQLRKTMTTQEEILWRALRNKGLGNVRFRRQQVITGFIVDFYCPSACLAHGPFSLHGNSFYGSLGNGDATFMTFDGVFATIDVYQYDGIYGITYLYSNGTGLNASEEPLGIAQRLN